MATPPHETEFVGLRPVSPSGEHQDLYHFYKRRSKYSWAFLESRLGQVLDTDVFEMQREDRLETWRFEAASPHVIMTLHDHILELCQETIAPDFMKNLLYLFSKSVYMVAKLINIQDGVRTRSMNNVGSIVIFQPFHRYSVCTIDMMCTFGNYGRRGLSSTLVALVLEMCKRTEHIRYAVAKTVIMGTSRVHASRNLLIRKFGFSENRGSIKLSSGRRTKSDASAYAAARQPLVITVSSNDPEEIDKGANDYNVYLDLWKTGVPMYAQYLADKGYIERGNLESLEYADLPPSTFKRLRKRKTGKLVSEVVSHVVFSQRERKIQRAKTAGLVAIRLCSNMKHRQLLHTLREFGNKQWEQVVESKWGNAFPFNEPDIRPEKQYYFAKQGRLNYQALWEENLGYLENLFEKRGIHPTRAGVLFASVVFYIAHLVAQRQSLDMLVSVLLDTAFLSGKMIFGTFERDAYPERYGGVHLETLLGREIDNWYSGADVGSEETLIGLFATLDYATLTHLYNFFKKREGERTEYFIQDINLTVDENKSALVRVLAERLSTPWLRPGPIETSADLFVDVMEKNEAEEKADELADFFAEIEEFEEESPEQESYEEAFVDIIGMSMKNTVTKGASLSKKMSALNIL